MTRTKTLVGWLSGAELGRRIGVSGASVNKYAERMGIRQYLRKGLPPLYSEEDVTALAAQAHIKGEGVTTKPSEVLAS